MSKIVSDARFLTPERLMELQEHADVQVSITSLLEGLELDDPETSEQIVGTLTAGEARLFRSLYECSEEAEAIARAAVGRHFSALGNSLQTSDVNKSLSDILTSVGDSLPRLLDGESAKFHRSERRAAMLHACLWWHVGERLGLHEWRLGVRTRGRIVKVEAR